MVIKVQYDAGSRTFKLVDQELRTLLEGDALYDLSIPFMFEEAGIEDSFSANGMVRDTHTTGQVALPLGVRRSMAQNRSIKTPRQKALATEDEQ